MRSLFLDISISVAIGASTPVEVAVAVDVDVDVAMAALGCGKGKSIRRKTQMPFLRSHYLRLLGAAVVEAKNDSDRFASGNWGFARKQQWITLPSALGGRDAQTASVPWLPSRRGAFVRRYGGMLMFLLNRPSAG